MADYDTFQKRRNVIVGVFVLVALIAFGWLVVKFRDLPIAFSKWTSYQVFVQFASAPGIQDGTTVRLGGYQIGRVIDVMAPQVRKEVDTELRYLQTTVILGIDKKYVTIPSNADVKLMKRGLGSSYIEISIDPVRELVAKDPSRPETKYMQDGMILQGSVGMVSEFFPEESQEKLEGFVNNINALIINANEVIGDKENKKNVRAVLANLNEVTAQARDTLEEVERLSATARSTMKDADSRVNEVADVALKSGEELNAALRELRMALEKLNEGEGTAGKMLTDGRLYENLLDSTEELRLALDEFKQVMEKTNKKGGIKFSIF